MPITEKMWCPTIIFLVQNVSEDETNKDAKFQPKIISHKILRFSQSGRPAMEIRVRSLAVTRPIANKYPGAVRAKKNAFEAR